MMNKIGKRKKQSVYSILNIFQILLSPIKAILFFVLFCFSQGNAAELKPWLGNFYEFELRSDITYRHYHFLAENEHLKKSVSNDVFLNLSLCNAIPDPRIGIEFEITEARTREQRGDIDQLKLTSRYWWLDDIAGDAVSLIAGLVYTQAFSKSLKDVSSFHHGLYNGEFFVSMGKEISDDGMLWGSRWWTVFSVGVAEQGSPWLSLSFDYEKRWMEKHGGGLFCKTLWGLGGKNLEAHHFRGYGPINHQSVDVGVRYTYEIDYFGHASIEYSFRPYAKNFPAYTHSLLAQILYTFGL